MSHSIPEGLADVLGDSEAILRFIHEQATDAGGDALRRTAAILQDELAPSQGRALSAYALSVAGAHSEAAERYEAWLSMEDSPAAFHVAQLCKSHSRLGDVDAVYEAARSFHPWDLDFQARAVADSALRRVGTLGVPCAHDRRRLALLGTFNTAPLVPCLRVGAARLGLALDIHVCEFDQWRMEIMNPDSGLYRHDPDYIVLATTWRDVEAGRAVDEQLADWLQCWDLLLERTDAHVLQHTFDRPVDSALGHLEARSNRAVRAKCIQLNTLLAERAPERVSFIDHEQAIYRHGAAEWCDPRQWYWAKEAVSDQAAPYLVEEYIAILRALTGTAKKACIVDLDNTLWGGVVGEDGVGGLALGPPSPIGEAHLAFQHYLLSLKAQGVLLAVCSKNNPRDARAPFERCGDMALSLDDFVAFEASWEPKPVCLQRISDELRLGLDSFVFVDDSPAERSLMLQALPEVWTMPMPADPSRYVDIVQRARAFETLGVSAEDQLRTQYHVSEGERKKLLTRATSMDEYYESLEMRCVMSPFVESDFKRITQLASRSNQFNFTTWRLTYAEVEELASSERHRTRTLRLQDRFGNHGLIMSIVGEVDGTVFRVLAWMMSCRVLGRGLEQLAMREIHIMAIDAGCDVVEGTHVPTEKNILVAELYPELGFERSAGEPGETTTWRRQVAASVPACPNFVELVEHADGIG